jgi:NTE family protein
MGPADQPDGGGRDRVALCLSGGGFRAALFHLGALRRLDELGVLSQVDTVSCVSGGSILAARLADYAHRHGWPASGQPIGTPAWEAEVAAPLRKFAGTNLRAGLVRRWWLLPWNRKWRGYAVEALAARYEALTPIRLDQLRHRPRFLFCATELRFGLPWLFTRPQTAELLLRTNRAVTGENFPHPLTEFGPFDVVVAPAGMVRDWTVARAVAASSCFPLLAGPLVTRIQSDAAIWGAMRWFEAEWELYGFEGVKGKASPERVQALRSRHYAVPGPLLFTDGGVADNTGLAAVWRTHQEGTVLVSDGGAPFLPEYQFGRRWFLQRVVAVMAVHAERRLTQWLEDEIVQGRRAGVVWSIHRAPSEYDREAAGYGKWLAHRAISAARTDLDAFSEGEQAVLENHGYCVADAALRKQGEGLVRREFPFAVPHPQWMDEQKAFDATVDSHQRKLFGRKGTA